MGEPTPNPGDECCGVITECCPNVAIPDVVTVRYRNISGCPEIDGMGHGLAINPDDPAGMKWSGDMELCDPKTGWHIELVCGWALEGGFTQCGGGSLVWNFDEENTECDPLMLVFVGTADIDMGCPCCTGAIEIEATVTR